MGRAGRVLQVSRRCAVKLQAQLRRVILAVRDPCVALRSLVASHIDPQQALSRDSLAALAHVSRTNVFIPSNIVIDTSAVMHRWCTGKTATVLAGTHGFESREGTFC